MRKLNIHSLITMLLMAFSIQSASSATFIVDNTGDNFGAPVAGTIRWAITQANAGAGPHTISFSGLLGAGPFVFTLVSPLTDLTTTNVTIDGATAPGYNCATGPMIIIVGLGFNDFTVSANSTLRAISFRDHVVLLGGAGITMHGCWFNLSNNGSAGAGGSPGNNYLVIQNCTNCIVGGPACGQPNVISGFNAGSMGTGLVNISTSSGLQFQNNFIGTDITGMTVLNSAGSSGEGIQLNSSDNVLIDNNVIASCRGGVPDGYGINVLSGTTNNLTIQNNKIGVNAAGSAAATAFGNDKSGIHMKAGGTGLLIQGNIICNNGKAGANAVDDCGVSMDATANYSGSIINNYIGVDASYALGGNKFYGIYLFNRANGITISGNVVGDNGNNGNPATYGGGISCAVNATVLNITIKGNYVGVAPNGANIGNHNNGIHLESGPTNITIGGTLAGDRNYIGFNKGKRTASNAGIYIFGCTDVTILGNSIGVGPTGGACGQQNAGGNALGGNGVFAGTGTLRVRIGSMANQNIISNNVGNGVNVYQGDFVEMRWNSMYCNGEKAIDLNCGANQGNNGFGCPATFTIVGVGGTPYVSVNGVKPANSQVDVFGTYACALGGGACLPQSQYRYGGTVADATMAWTYNNGSAMVDDISAAATGSGANCNTGYCRTSELLCVDNPLPVTLLSFKAEKSNKNIVLTWKTGFEKDNDYFLIEKSIDGETFYPIGKVNGSGDLNEAFSYSYEDMNILQSDILFYRLKQVDINGEYSYSHIATVNISDMLYKVYPNPNTGSFNVSWNRPEGQVEIVLYDATGRCVYQNAVKVSENQNHLINLQDALPGMYLMIIKTEEKVHSEKIFVY
ncbi:MAG: T9SS type A sorting domain-containing protein [Cytophagaceae bacterium]|nr:T9SS type A sorting domain-containing protein [Cytophagaceae bacterium]